MSFIPQILSSASESLAATSGWIKVPVANTIWYMGYEIASKGRTYCEYANYFRKNPESQKFINDHAKEMGEIPAKVARLSGCDSTGVGVLQNFAKMNADTLAIKGNGLQCVGTFLKSIPLLTFALQTSSVIGLLGTGVVTVTVLTPVLGHLIDLVAEILHCKDSTKEKIYQLTKLMEKLDNLNNIYTYFMLIPTLAFANTFSQDGLQAGLFKVAMSSVIIGLTTLYLKKYENKIWSFNPDTRPVAVLKEKIKELQKARKTPPSDEKLKELEKKDHEICKKYYDAVDESMRARDEYNRASDVSYKIPHAYSDKDLDTDDLSYLEKICIDKEDLKQLTEVYIPQVKKIQKSASTNTMLTREIYDKARENETKIALEIDYENKHKTYVEAKNQYNNDLWYYQKGARNEYRATIASLRTKSSSHDELPWLVDYLKMLVEIEQQMVIPVTSAPIDLIMKTEAATKLKKLNESVSAQRKKLIKNEDDCMEMHLTRSTIKWLTQYERSANHSIREFKKHYGLDEAVKS